MTFVPSGGGGGGGAGRDSNLAFLVRAGIAIDAVPNGGTTTPAGLGLAGEDEHIGAYSDPYDVLLSGNRINIRTTGDYLIEGTLYYLSHVTFGATGLRAWGVTKNGTGLVATDALAFRAAASTVWPQSVRLVVWASLTKGDYVQVGGVDASYLYQSSGVSLNAYGEIALYRVVT